MRTFEPENWIGLSDVNGKNPDCALIAGLVEVAGCLKVRRMREGGKIVRRQMVLHLRRMTKWRAGWLRERVHYIPASEPRRGVLSVTRPEPLLTAAYKYLSPTWQKKARGVFVFFRKGRRGVINSA